MAHPTPQALAVLLQVLPRTEKTVQYKVLDILEIYKDPQKISPLLEFMSVIVSRHAAERHEYSI